MDDKCTSIALTIKLFSPKLMDMKFYIKTPKHLKQAYSKELGHYRYYLSKKQYSDAWYHLERSQIIGQSYPIKHTCSHWLMLKFGLMQKDNKEVFGLIIRLVDGGWKSFYKSRPAWQYWRCKCTTIKSDTYSN
ncbi:Protein of unknown function [Arenibacter nanhaiticus]|uniref:DUF3703 domain-containing protein n=1 Tax=Arenibacter nanhaiticus TaxID=558155 RepID=A0A1M6KV02_9FLAO|nr:Protein of unknown function [Arenibacter nanhaiticus]